eukprot:14740005-Ditylum_brightwellii.AAC.1
MLHHFQVEAFSKEVIQVIKGKLYLFGVVGDSVGKEGKFASLKPMNISGAYILSAFVLANDVEKEMVLKGESEVIDNFFKKTMKIIVEIL